MSDMKMPQRWDFDVRFGGYIDPTEDGDFVRVEDVQPLLTEIERLRGERDVLKTAARECLTTLAAAVKTGQFDMNGTADMCHFVQQAMQRLNVLAFDREEKSPVGLEGRP